MNEESEFQQSRRLDFEPGKAGGEAAPARSRGDAAGFKGQDTGEDENQFFSHIRYNQTIALVANGEFAPSLAEQIQSCDTIIAVDGGLVHLDALKIKPDLILGDFDSAPEPLLNQYAGTPLKRFARDKDKTDLELAISHATALEPNKIILFGALGKRTDHALTNLFLLAKFPDILVILTETETITAIQGKTTLKTSPGQTVSLLPYGIPAENVTTRGLRWELQEATIDTQFFSQSNEALGTEVAIEIGSGLLFCFVHSS